MVESWKLGLGGGDFTVGLVLMKVLLCVSVTKAIQLPLKYKGPVLN